MQSPGNCAMVTDANRLPPAPEEEIPNTETSIKAVEELLKYRFKNTKLLEEALTHSSCPNSASNYQRLAFVGDAALGLAISSYFFVTYPHVDCGKLTDLRAANVSTEKLARVAVRHGLYKYLRRDSAILDEKVKEFVITVQQEEEMEFYGGMIKAPKVLADIVESVMGAVYLDCGFDVNAVWVIFRGLLEPIIMLNMLEEQPQPVTMLFVLCKKDGKQVDVEHQKEGGKNIASVFLDGQFIASASSEHKENAKLQVAKAALKELYYNPYDKMDVEVVPCQRKMRDVQSILFQKQKMDIEFDPTKESEGAKQKLNELCQREKWPKPTYRVEKEIGPAHDRKFICSVQIAIAEGMLFVMGEEKSRVKDGENSAALAMIQSLQGSKFS
ncbi:ribonuclease 3-like protein 2 [Solanum dulcamara]|uniref:ribonuclease 3-like protein 2 n=1 Tax=Solanum dulcamara TaxID=45834 RepID=UPI002484FC92|nr:ribonuclease 3-like protein 2 [Solanum dulcamara]